MGKEVCNVLPQPDNTFYGMQLETFGPFEDSKLGIGLTYSSKTKRFSLFIYDMGMERFDASSVEQFFHQSAQEFYQIAEYYNETITNAYDLSETDFGKKKKKTVLFKVSFDKSNKSEFLGMGTDGVCLYKIRFTSNTFKDNDVMNEYGQAIHLIEEILGF